MLRSKGRLSCLEATRAGIFRTKRSERKPRNAKAVRKVRILIRDDNSVAFNKREGRGWREKPEKQPMSKLLNPCGSHRAIYLKENEHDLC